MFQILLLTSKRCCVTISKKGVDVKNMNNDERARFTLRMPKKLFDEIQALASDTGVSANALILQILWEWIETR